MDHKLYTYEMYNVLLDFHYKREQKHQLYILYFFFPKRVKPGFSEIVGENIEVDIDPAGNPVKAKWNFSNSCGLAFSGSPLGDNRKYEIIFSGSGHARIGLTQNDPDHIRDIQEAVRKNQILFVSDVRYHKRQCVVDIMKKGGIGGSKFVTKYKDDSPQIKDLLSSNDVWAVIYLKFGNITAEIKGNFI